MPRAIVLAALAAAAILPVASADARPTMQVSAQDDGLLLSNPALAVARAQHLGVRSFRVIVRGTRGLAAYDAGIEALRAARIQVDVTLSDYHPSVLTGAPGTDFVALAARRWPFVRSWGFWNEPNNNMSPGEYRRVFIAGRRIVARLTPRAKTVFGEVQPAGGLDFLRKTLRGGHVKADVLGIHPYQFDEPPRSRDSGYGDGIGRLPAYRRLLPKLHGARLWITEFGYWAWGKSGARGLAPRKAERWMGQALTFARRQGVRHFTVYSVSPATGPWDTALLDESGRARPVYYAVRRALAH